jgi:hypothetical protein
LLVAAAVVFELAAASVGGGAVEFDLEALG